MFQYWDSFDCENQIEEYINDTEDNYAETYSNKECDTDIYSPFLKAEDIDDNDDIPF